MGLENLTPEQSQELVQSYGAAREQIYCEEHGFYPGRNPLNSNPHKPGCKSCVMATMMMDFATTPPHLRAERVAQLESLVKNLIKESETNKDFNPDAFFNNIQIDVEHEEDEPANKG